MTVFVAGIGVPDGLAQKAAADTPSSGTERSVEGRAVAPKPVPKGVEDLQEPLKPAEPVWPKAGSATVDLSKGKDAVAVPGLPVSVAAVDPAPVAKPVSEGRAAGDAKAPSPSPSPSASSRPQESPSSIQVETFDDAAVRRLGGVGIGVRLTRGDGGASPAPV
ncbi:hypothetical protein, partial [Sphaerimonospora mesophila]|uniref:hypothetical protein n=1 Tax=Sphaerimonospora mesophila TaxID=37483 RepID=UPI00128F4A31